MYVYLSMLRASLINELYCIIEYAFDLLSNMILKVIFFIGNLIIEIVRTIVGSTVDHMCDAVFLEDILILSNEITS